MNVEDLKIELIKYVLRKYFFSLDKETQKINVFYYKIMNNYYENNPCIVYRDEEQYNNRNILLKLSKPNHLINVNNYLSPHIQEIFIINNEKDELFNYRNILRNISNYNDIIIESSNYYLNYNSRNNEVINFFKSKIKHILTQKAMIIQKNFRKYRYDPQFKFCWNVQLNGLRNIGVDV
jgi:hypothetical protein